ncbi:MAG: hypothetical protein ABL982_18520, partial [Vicinamibacterales bacterium]
ATITFTATARGGTAPYQYKWWVFDGHSWSLSRDWSTSPILSWSPRVPNSSYRVAVWVRSAQSVINAADNEDANRSVAFPITR